MYYFCSGPIIVLTSFVRNQRICCVSKPPFIAEAVAQNNAAYAYAAPELRGLIEDDLEACRQ